MNEITLKQSIEKSLKKFSDGTLLENGHHLLQTLGYKSQHTIELSPNTIDGFLEYFPSAQEIKRDKALVNDWLSVDILFQLTVEDIKDVTQGRFVFDRAPKIDNQIIESYLFIAISLKGSQYTRTQLANLTREINKIFPMPVMIIIQHDENLTFSIIHRRLNKKDESRDVLEKVTLIKDISINKPHRGHIEIIFDLSLHQLAKDKPFTNFIELQKAWEKTLDTSELNKKFYKEIANWYFSSQKKVSFPAGGGDNNEIRNATNLIRLITRLIFVWFIKEKDLVPEELFDQKKLKDILNYSDPSNSTYYKAILQNLFFATLNTEMGDNRGFRKKNSNPKGFDGNFGISSLYRYENYFIDPDEALSLFSNIPFLNGGLFECLDKREEKIIIDGFSDNPKYQANVPDDLFFGTLHDEDLSEFYGSRRNKQEKVRGIINIFNDFKFTIEENTPVEEEIALDPELLGKVFENLLASYNPETGTTARKQTGSFYTPREIVNYMVDEALIEYLKTKLGDLPNAEERLRHLFEYNQEDHQFSLDETKNIINAIDEVNVLDPACGSGAFPMGVLHKLVFILNKLDTGNKFWKEKQIAKAIEIPDPEVRNRVISEIDLAFEDNELDYGRKLFLIENCIYGVDIQPIAVQIAKLRFFISLVVDQKSDVKKSNLGIRPLPNLETKFVAANSIIHIERPQQMMLHNPLIEEKEKKLAAVRSSLFTARTPETKRKYRDIDYKLREKLAILLESDGWGSKSASQLSSWNPYDQNSSAEFLDPEWMFGIKEGFDIVIGNPPYITLRSLDEEIKNYIKQNYRYSRGGDIYVAFIERSINLLNKRGILSFIVPNKFFGADYGKAIRKYLQFGEPEIISIWDLKDEKVFENAMISTIVLIVRNQRIGTIPILKQDEDRFEFPNLFDSDGKIQIDSNEKSKLIIQKIKKYPVLQKFADIRTGIMGFDYWKMEPIVQDKQPNSDLIRLFTNGNFSRYTNKWGYKWVNLYKKKYLYPVIKLDPQFINQNTIKLFKTTPKIIVRGVSKRLAAILDDHGAGLLVAVHTIIPIKISMNYVLGLLNSEFLNWYHLNTQYSVRIPEGSLKYPISFYKHIPIPEPNTENAGIISAIENYVEDLLLAKREKYTSDTSELEKKIDLLVYELYGLNEDDINIIENRPSLSELFICDEDDNDLDIDVIIDSEDDNEKKDVNILIDPKRKPIEYGLYKCSLCGSMIMGFDLQNHERDEHEGKSVEWKKIR